MNKLDNEKKVAVIKALVEGASIRATVRMTGVAKNTIVRILAQVGQAADQFHNEYVRNLASKRIETDEIWSFVGAKEKNVPQEKKTDVKSMGDFYTWTAIDADSKLIISFLLGDRGIEAAKTFLTDLKSRISDRIQLTTDGHKSYLNAVQHVFDGAVDYAQIIKQYDGETGVEDRKYSAPKCIGTKKMVIQGNPKHDLISTSYVERQNLTMRMQMRRFTRLTNGFSKKVENHYFAIALHFFYYNFVRVHQSLKVTPAMEAGLTKKPMTIQSLIDFSEGKQVESFL
jgi:IS1 family transposase